MKPILRSIVAVFVAPLAAPVVVVAVSGFSILNNSLVSLLITVVLAYFGMIVFGVPLFFLFKRRGFVRLWSELAAGFVIGIVMWLIFLVSVGLAFREPIGFVLNSIAMSIANDAADTLYDFGFAGVCGAAAGLLFWLIARPDKARAEKV